MARGHLKRASQDGTAAAIREAVGAGPNEVVEIVTPTFERPKDWSAVRVPPKPFQSIRILSRADLKALGCRAWDEPNDKGMVLMLFPGEWYDHVPEGFVVIDINGEPERFARGVIDNDIRFGCLSFGIEVKA